MPLGPCATDPGRLCPNEGIHDETHRACRRGCRARRDRRRRPERPDRRPQGADEGERQPEPHRPRDDRRQAAVQSARPRRRCWRPSPKPHDKAKTLWPDSSKAGDTAALPAIWENKADFDAKLAKFSADAKAAEAKVTDLDSFKAQMGEVGKNCGGCHNTYRKRAS